jgi:tRNA threonylcarbamoyladenosine biosynthesis protein TsaB
MALSIPLIAVSTLEAMARSVEIDSAQYILPMLDARRMEVYSQLFKNNDGALSPESEIVAEVIEESYFNKFLNSKVVLVGPGASKLKELLANFENLELIDGVFPDAVFMASLAGEAFKKQQFEDVAYYEPFYLKDFIALKSTKNLLG